MDPKKLAAGTSRIVSSLIWHLLFAAAIGQLLAATPASAADKARPGQRWALLIGIDDYDDTANLAGLRGLAGADMRDLAAQLVRSGFPEDQVIVMHDRASEKKFFPYKKQIQKQLELLLDPTQGAVKKGDLVIVAFAGHGMESHGRSYLCPTEAEADDPAASMIAVDDLYDRLKASRAALKLLLVDACRNDPTRRGESAAGMPAGFAQALSKPPQGLLVLTSCGAGQEALGDPKLGHGVFMHFVLEGLKGKAADEEGSIRLARLYDYASDQTQRYVRREFSAFQTPALEGRIDGNFELCRVDPKSVPANPLGDTLPAAPGRVITNSIGMKLVTIPAGEFLMGSDETKADLEKAFKLYDGFSNDDERPKHRVRITRPFSLGVYEVTRGQFGRFVETASYQTEAEKDGKGGWGWDEAEKKFRQDAKFSWRSPGFAQTDEHPVVNVSWNDAVAFCDWLSKKEGKRYRLPTEAEWEYACRAGTTTRFSSGDDPESLAAVGNVADGTAKAKYPDWKSAISARDGYVYTAPVGQFRANPFGLYDMHGNAWEWCSDWYDEKYYGTSPQSDPSGPGSGSYRVNRGGGWGNGPVDCRSAIRDWFDPSLRCYYLGFRAVLVP